MWLTCCPSPFHTHSGPLDSPKTLKSGKSTFTPHDYVPVFKKKGVSAVIRLNKPMYNRNAFLSAGIKHADMFYPDGGNPPEQILRHFIEVRWCGVKPAQWRWQWQWPSRQPPFEGTL